MADLNIAPATGDQGTTQNPQSVPAGQTVSGASTQSGGVQPGTAQAILTSPDGLSLHSTPLTAVSLDATTTTTTQVQAQPAATPPKAHHMNTALIAISIGLIILAVGLFWAISRSAKNTTE